MSKEKHSSFLNETEEIEEIIENDLPKKILPSTSSIKKDAQFPGSCIAISPDSKQIVTFDPVKCLLKLFDTKDLSSSKPISISTHLNLKPDTAPKVKTSWSVKDKVLLWSGSDAIRWSIAISNCVGDEENERLIAVSCFDAKIFHHDDKEDNAVSCFDAKIFHCDDDESDLESGDKYPLRLTRVISTKDNKEIYTSSNVGVIRFLNSDDGDKSLKNKTTMIIVNASGIFKETIKNKKGIFSRSSEIEQFELPQQLSKRLLRDRDDSLELLHTSIIKNHFMVHSFENRQQIIEMYSLITGDLEMLFKRYRTSAASNIIHSSPIFAISQNEKILAFCRETTNITLFSMENGLEITTKRLEGQRGIYKIANINFIDADSKLLIVLEEKEDRHRGTISENHQVFVVWDLFTTFENSVRQNDYSEPKSLKMGVTYRLMNAHENVFAVKDGKDANFGSIFSVLDHKDVDSIRNPSEKAMIEFDSKKFEDTGTGHVIYTMDGERIDTYEKNELIINNVEPWNPVKNYFRISIFLDHDKSTQLIISNNTIQVWKYRNNNAMEKRDKHDRVLEYIWAREKNIIVQELKIGEREFSLKVLVPSTKGFTPPKIMKIHWPNNINVLEGACRALSVLVEKKNSIITFENVNQIKFLFEHTQRLVRKYIPKYGIFRLTSIRYPIMKYLIKGCQESLIKRILNKRNIYIPRLYKWVDNNRSTTKISNSDLHHAIDIQERGDSTLILKYLIDYYADNTKEYNNHGWMFTVSEAIPVLYDKNLGEFVQYLFKKPCFGITEAYTPPLHIDPDEQKKGNKAAVIHSLVVKPSLASKSNKTLWLFLKNLITSVIRWYFGFRTSRRDRKVYIVPLPDFTVPPNPKDDLKDESEFVQYLFKKPCFGITEAYTPPLHIDPDEQKKGNKAAVIHSLVVKPSLASKSNKTLWLFLKNLITSVIRWYFGFRTSRRDRKVYIVPLPDFTVPPNPKDDLKDESENYSKYFWFLLTLLWPRRKVINNTEDMSPFHRIIHEENSDEIYRTPTILAVLDFKWSAAQIMQLIREGWSRYMNIYNLFDLGSVLLPLAVSIVATSYDNQTVFNTVLAFTILVLWFELILLMRYFERPGSYIYIIYNISTTIWPFFAFMLIADDLNLQIPTYKINDTSNSDLNITIFQVVESSQSDSNYSSPLSAIKAVYDGNWDQSDQLGSYAIAINAMSILGSLILVLIFQNMLIAFMSGAFEKASEEGLTAVHRYRVEPVAEYESLKKYFGRDNSRYIYYIPDPDMIDTWLTETKEDDEQESQLTDFDYSDDDGYDDDDDDDGDDENGDDDNDDDDDDNQDNSSHLKKYRHIQNEGSLSSMDLNSIKPTFDKISFLDEETFLLKVAASKSKKKSQKNRKSNNKSLKNVGDNKLSNEPLSEDSGPTNVDDQLSMEKKFNNMENEFKTKFTELDQNLKTILETLKNLKNSK
ncbi:hypothetical protein Glove_23g170 [Diversispora epigaea]|uniref:Ion transport domain-containing protein n=1 Tax=Diversispora epigaea TaxID=1348612 RepID=A0A397JJ28_9GLOM|nr:hypothetical protein Glove_23g170 [Diversispora epigaea]